MSMYKKFIKYIWRILDPYDNGKITFGQLLDNSPIKMWQITLVFIYILSIYRIMKFDGRETFILEVSVMYVFMITATFIVMLFIFIVMYLVEEFSTRWDNLRRKTVLSCKRQDNLNETSEE